MRDNKVVIAVIIMGLILIFKQELKQAIINLSLKKRVENIITPKIEKFNVQQDTVPRYKESGYLIREGFHTNVNGTFIKFVKWDNDNDEGVLIVDGVKDKFKNEIQGRIKDTVYYFYVFYDSKRDGWYLKLTELDSL